MSRAALHRAVQAGLPSGAGGEGQQRREERSETRAATNGAADRAHNRASVQRPRWNSEAKASNNAITSTHSYTATAEERLTYDCRAKGVKCVVWCSDSSSALGSILALLSDIQ